MKALKALVIGSNGFIGKRLVETLPTFGIEVTGADRTDIDLLNLDLKRWLTFDVVYICAGVTKFLDCESNPDAYRVNVDAPIEIGRFYDKVVFLSSEVVEKGLHTAYGLQKALAEVGLRGVCNPVIARLCKKVTVENLESCCSWLANLAKSEPGVYRWT